MDFARNYFYFDRPLSVAATLERQFAMLALAFVLVAVSVVIVHLWLPGPQPAGLVISHAIQVATAYTLSIALLGYLLQRIGMLRGLRVWHFWALSFTCHVLGFLLHGLDDTLTVALHHDVQAGGSLHHFLRLLPLWALITALLAQPYVHGTLDAETQSPNARPGSERSRSVHPGHRVRIEAGRKRLDLPASAISHITVDDHYCYLHHGIDGRWEKTDFGLPLRELLELLPEQFIQIHRSHAINLQAVTQISRRGRTYLAHVAGAADPLAISRKRVEEVLSRIESRA